MGRVWRDSPHGWTLPSRPAAPHSAQPGSKRAVFGVSCSILGSCLRCGSIDSAERPPPRAAENKAASPAIVKLSLNAFDIPAGGYTALQRLNDSTVRIPVSQISAADEYATH